MKRSRHRWMGLTVFSITLIVLATELPTTSAIKATSLIFARTSTSTAAPEELPPEGEDGPQTETTAEGADDDSSNSTSNKYTGIPQIDYLLDPNLPRELNGYNLSEYPFYATVPAPELMDFKCDGLHDGFYASAPHKCQVYHHCLYGTRYDFLCANYTAFDQKTFICQFVSEVDCKNSADYFHRNEALYKAASTDPPPPPPTTTTTTTTTVRPPRPSRRRPLYRYDYYDDDYYYRDDYDYGERRRPRPRPGGRPENKNRPVDDYEDDRYERRPRPRDEVPDDDFGERRPYGRRPGKRRPYADDEDTRPGYRSGGNRRPRPRDDDEQFRSDDDERPRGGKRNGPREDSRPKRPRDEYRSRDESNTRDDKRPSADDNQRNEKDDIRPRDEIRSRDEIRPRDEIKPRDESISRDDSKVKDMPKSKDEFRPRDSSRTRDERRPPRDESPEKPKESRPRDDRYQNEGRRYRDDRPNRNREDRPYSKPDKTNEDNDRSQDEKKENSSGSEGQGLVKPNGHGLFSQPRAPPKVKRPVPLSERQKYEYATMATTKPPPKAEDDEYYDYEEDETSKPSSSGKTTTIQQRPKPEVIDKDKFKPSRPSFTNTDKGQKTKRPVDYDEEYYDEPIVKTRRYTNNQHNKDDRPKLKGNVDDYYDDDEKKEAERKEKEEAEVKVKNVRHNVRIVKRPFLPSRGGSPYLPRGLKPVAGRDVTVPINTTPKPTTTTTTTTAKPTTTEPTTTTTTTTTTSTTTPIPTTTKQTTTLATEIPTAKHSKAYDEEYEYYDEEDIDYDKDKKELTADIKTPAKPETSTPELTTQELKAKHLANKVLRVYNDNYEAIRDKLESTLSPGDYIKPYLATSLPLSQDVTEKYRPKIKAEISKPYTATGKPLIPDNISIKQNLADSLESDYDVSINDALSPTLPVSRVPSGFISPNRDYTFSRYRNNFHQAEPQFAASELTYQVRSHPQVSIRTPSSYYLQPQRLVYQDELARHPRQLIRQILGDFI